MNFIIFLLIVAHINNRIYSLLWFYFNVFIVINNAIINIIIIFLILIISNFIRLIRLNQITQNNMNSYLKKQLNQKRALKEIFNPNFRI